MNKILLLGTFFLLFVLATEALDCHVCKRFELNGRCVLGESSCKAGPGQKCFITLVEKATEALYCHVCKQLDPNGRCVLGESSCEANSEQKCIIKLANEGTKIYNRKGCTTKLHQCKASEFSVGRTITTECCDHRDYCNAGILNHMLVAPFHNVREGQNDSPTPEAA